MWNNSVSLEWITLSFFSFSVFFGHIKFQKNFFLYQNFRKKKKYCFCTTMFIPCYKELSQVSHVLPILVFRACYLSLEESDGVWSFSPEKCIMCTKVSMLLCGAFMAESWHSEYYTARRTFGNSSSFCIVQTTDAEDVQECLWPTHHLLVHHFTAVFCFLYSLSFW